MRAPFGVHFLGQVGTFTYLTETMRFAPEFDMAAWPQFSIYNLLIANLWPIYWLARLWDSVKVEHAYWRVFEVAAARASDVHRAMQYLIG